MNWFTRIASDKSRLMNNIVRLEDLQNKVHDLAWFATASGSGAFTALKRILTNHITLGHPIILAKLKEALIGENNQKIALDAPLRFRNIMFETEVIISREIGKIQSELRKLNP